MNVIELRPLIEKKESLQKRSAYQAKGYACLDALTLENWAHRWKWIEISRKGKDGAVSFWQFEFRTNKLEFSHFHRAINVAAKPVDASRLWRGLEVIEQYPGGFHGPADIDIEHPEIPDDVLVEAKKQYLEQFEKNLEIVLPEECA